MDKEENKDTKNEAESPQPDNLNISDEEILKKLQDAYTSINNLKNSPTHKKILLSLERKIRAEKKNEKKA